MHAIESASTPLPPPDPLPLHSGRPPAPDTPRPIPHAPLRRGRAVRSDATWDLARDDYLAGDSAEQVCHRYGLSPSTFSDRARRFGWRKRDQPDPEPVPDIPCDADPDGTIDCAALAEQALNRVAQALHNGRASEAASWMRVHDKLLARIEAEAARAGRRERVARSRGTGAADEALADALRPLRERMAFLNALGAAQVRVGRAWGHGHISTAIHDRLNGLHSGVAEAYYHSVAAHYAASRPGSSGSSHPEFSAAADQ